MKKTSIFHLVNAAVQIPNAPQEYYRLTNSTNSNQVNISGYIGWYDDEALWLKNYLREHEGQDVEINMTSVGGDVFTGMNMYNALKAHKGKTICNVQQAFSIASHIAMACDVINIVKGGQMMIHAVSGGCYGTEDDFTAYSTMMSNAKEAIAESYTVRTGHDKESWLDVMKNDAGKFYSATECVELGLADAIIEPSNMTNAFAPPVNQKDATTPPATPPQAEPLTNQMDEKEMNELARRTAIQKLYNSFLLCRPELPYSLLNQAIEDINCDTQAASVLFAAYKADDGTPPAGTPPVNFNAGNFGGKGSDSRQMVTNVLLNRAGLEELLPDNRNWAGLSLQNAATQMGIQGAGDALINAALNNQDFIDVLGEIAQKSVTLENESTESLVKKHCKVDKFAKLGEFGITEYDQVKAIGKRIPSTGLFPNHAITGQPERKGVIEEFGKNFLVTRMALINDEFNVISDLPRQFVNAAWRSADKNFMAVLAKEVTSGAVTAHDARLLLIAMANVMESQTTSDGDDLYYEGGIMLCSSANKRIAKAHNDSMYLDPVNKVANEAYGTFAKFFATTRIGAAFVSFAEGQKPVSLAVLHGRENPALIPNQSVNAIDGVGFGIVFDHGIFVNNPKAMVTGKVDPTLPAPTAFGYQDTDVLSVSENKEQSDELKEALRLLEAANLEKQSLKNELENSKKNKAK